ncbi:MAG: glycosyltransferase family 4 protein, partial [Pyrinomonadaceae bacterium]|nr:glycosyltransferase family 4 protein [Pyrinomonadaceae bacterium]
LADAIFIENYWLKEILDKKFAEKTFFAPPGIDTDFFTPKPSENTGYILSVGRFNDVRKNVKMLFRAYSRLLEIIPDAPRLVMAGLNAPTKEDFAVAKTLQIIDKIDVFTNVSIESLRDIYQNASVFALSSDEEGFGLVIIEAMCCCLPVVATRCGGAEVSIINGENGFLVPLNDSEAMANRIAELLRDDEKRITFGKRARESAVKNYSIKATSKIYLETYRRLLG